MANSLCSRCFHSYVCEQFNEHRDSTAEYTCCHFYNDHFVDAADVKPVKHGRWVDRYGGKYANPLYECSECKEAALKKTNLTALDNWITAQVLSAYCPHCGADMREDST